MPIVTVNPANGETLEEYEPMSAEGAKTAVRRSHEFFRSWRDVPFSRRSEHMEKAAAVLRDRKDALAKLMALEMGKPIWDGRAEAEKCAWVCEHYARSAGEMLATEIEESDADESFVAFRPLGVLLAVMPWNYPFWQVFRFAAPALMAGNTVVLKHASNVSGCSLSIEKIFSDAGFAREAFQSLLVSSSDVAAIVEDPLVRGVTLTGSRGAGRAVAAVAGKMLKKTVLELGGSDPYLVLEDADLPSAAKICADARMLNSGQSCIAAKRFIVVESARKRFEELLVEEMEHRKMGDPLSEDVRVGPQAKGKLREKLHGQVVGSAEKGARILLGGRIPDGPGFFYPPTVLSGVEPGMPAFDSETFGPVASIVSARTESEAVELANRSDFGLGGAVFSRDVERATRIAVEKIESGSCFVNDFVKSDPRLPFGGVKDSGYGRELSAYGIKEFVNVKTVCVKKGFGRKSS